MTFDEFQEALENGFIRAQVCCVCGGAADHTLIYHPSKKMAFQLGQRPGKQRLFYYGVCEKCRRTHGEDEVAERAEAMIHRDMKVQKGKLN